MSHQHIFKAEVNWQLKPGASTQNPKTYSRNHKVKIDNIKDALEVSAAKMFHGDPTLYNPEDLLLSALASCHMMSYLYVCAQHRIEVVSYNDNAEAYLNVAYSGRGQFTKAQLNPIVTIKHTDKQALALSLHKQANSLCFIANSCNFPITHQAKIIVAK